MCYYAGIIQWIIRKVGWVFLKLLVCFTGFNYLPLSDNFMAGYLRCGSGRCISDALVFFFRSTLYDYKVNNPSGHQWMRDRYC